MLVPLFLAQLARIEPQEAELRFRKLAEVTIPKLAEPQATNVRNSRERCLSQAAAAIASDHPVEAERLINLMESRITAYGLYTRSDAPLPATGEGRPAAGPSGRRLAGLATPNEPAPGRSWPWAWPIMTVGRPARPSTAPCSRSTDSASRARNRNRSVPARSFHEPRGVDPAGRRADRAERLPDVFWRAVDLFTRFEPENVDSHRPRLHRPRMHAVGPL